MFLDKLFFAYRTIFNSGGVALPTQPAFKFTGAGVTVSNDPINALTVINVPGGGGGGVASVTAADGTVTIGGTGTNPTVAVGAVPQSQVTGLVSALAAKVGSVTAANATVTVGGTATAPTVAVNVISESQVTNLVSDLMTLQTAVGAKVDSVTAGNTSVTIGGTPTAPTVQMNRVTAIDSFTKIQWLMDGTTSPWSSNTGNGGALDMLVRTGSPLSNNGLFTRAVVLNGNVILDTSGSGSGTTTIGETTDDISISMWVYKFATTNASGELIAGKNYNTGATWSSPFTAWGIFQNSSNNLEFSVTDSGGTQHKITMISQFELLVNMKSQWVLLSMTYQKSTGTFLAYVNGNPSTATVSPSISANTALGFGSHGGYVFGGIASGTGQCLNGKLDDVRIEPGVVRSQAYYLAMYKLGIGQPD